MKNYIKEYILENYKMIFIFVFFLALGIIVGIISYQVIDENVKLELVDSIKSTLDLSKAENFEGFNIIKNGIVSNTLLIIVIYFTAITLICTYLLIVLNLLKGFAIGMYIPTLISLFGIKSGVIAIILMVIIPNLIYIFTFIYSCVNSCNISRKIVSNEKSLSLFIIEIIKIVISFSIIFLGVIIEQITSTYVISLYKSI